MHVFEVMTKGAQYVEPETTIMEAAEMMRELNSGFLPVGNEQEDKLKGVVTDRDIAIRAVAEGLDARSCAIDEIMTDKVLYCFEQDDIHDVANNMREQQVYRLIVLNNRNEKRLRGVISLGDISRRTGESELVGKTAKGISKNQQSAA